MSKYRPHPPAAIALACIAFLLSAPQAGAADMLNSPNWQIFLSDAGYSDYLGDQTPGFEGREYLSGEWGAAVGYGKGGQNVGPTWLEPNFVFPDWTTNSNFTVDTPLGVTGSNDYGLPVATSVLSNGDLRITQTVEILDTRIGTPMGLSPASAADGKFNLSNRYVMLHSYGLTNLSDSETFSDLQFFQFLHGLTAQFGTYDDRAYTGPLSDYRYDVVLGGDASGGAAQFDYIGFHAKVAPTAIEIGHYGIDTVDDHMTGKPSVGTHLSIEANALNGNDAFHPANLWVGGAQRWDLGSLAPGQTKTMEVMLTILTGWQVAPNPDGSVSGSANGGSGTPGGLDYEFDGVDDTGLLFVEYEAEDLDSVQEMISLGEIGPLTFAIPGDRLQLFEVEFEGSLSGQIRLTFAYDAGLLPAGFDPLDLRVYHWTGSQWEDLGGAVDPVNHTITVTTTSLSPFAVAAVPEPQTWAMLIAGLGLTLLRLRRRG